MVFFALQNPCNPLMVELAEENYRLVLFNYKIDNFVRQFSTMLKYLHILFIHLITLMYVL